MTYPIYEALEIPWLGIRKYNQNTVIYLQDVFGVSSQRITYMIGPRSLCVQA